jgi:hypothetical protein
MTGRLHFTASALLVLVAGQPAAAHAADPAFCRPYARAALVQARGALASPHCGAGLQGARWSTEFSVQYEWCLGASPEALAAEREARARTLKRCTDR